MLHMRLILGVVLSALLTGIAVAGPSSSASGALSPQASDAAAPLVHATLCGEGLSPLVGSQLHKAWLDSPIDAAAAPTIGGGSTPGGVVTLPGGPSSSSLVAAGLLCIGAFGGLRSLRKAHFGSLPEWYSTSGPQQIGHATPIDFDFPVLEIRPFESVEPLVPICDGVLPRVTAKSQRNHLTRVSPRAPPL
ncbi:MAG: hypothetical protein IT450_18785 [Phycisphaerales bacterium]|nr:hypothetical protein [Phycisphaerales bacterium]